MLIAGAFAIATFGFIKIHKKSNCFKTIVMRNRNSDSILTDKML